jgi:UDP-GlcNAc:undecaprenyl-phosphate GlcNAc-1-phosphate transferase
MIWLCLSLIVVGFGISVVLTRVLIAVGHRAGAMDGAGVAGHAKTEIRRVPNIGGVAIFAGIVLPVVVGLVVLWAVASGDGSATSDGASMVPSALRTHVNGVLDMAPSALVLVGCLAVLHVVGLIDDRRALGAWPKLGVMVGTAAAVVLLTDGTRLLSMLDPYVGGAWLSIVITVVWIVLVTNAMNFIDNMDGLSGGVCAVASGLFLAATLVQGQWFVAAMLALLLGSVLGFLVFNVAPAKIFMGDGGSLVIGFLLAFLTVRTTYYAAPGSVEAETMVRAPSVWYGVFMPLVVLAIPLYDFVSVTAIRLWQGKSPFVGDMQHFSHRLVTHGLSKRAAVVVIWGLTLVTGIGGVSLASLEAWQAVLVGVQTVTILVVLAILEYSSRGREGAA